MTTTTTTTTTRARIRAGATTLAALTLTATTALAAPALADSTAPASTEDGTGTGTGTLTLRAAVPEEAGPKFTDADVTVTATGPTTFSNAGDAIEAHQVPPGAYTLSAAPEEAASSENTGSYVRGWQCSVDGVEQDLIESRTATIDIEAGQNVFCYAIYRYGWSGAGWGGGYYGDFPVRLTIEKVTPDGEPLEGATFTASRPAGGTGMGGERGDGPAFFAPGTLPTDRDQENLAPGVDDYEPLGVILGDVPASLALPHFPATGRDGEATADLTNIMVGAGDQRFLQWRDDVGGLSGMATWRSSLSRTCPTGICPPTQSLCTSIRTC